MSENLCGGSIWNRIMWEARKEEGRCMEEDGFKLTTFLQNLTLRFGMWDEFRGEDCEPIAWLAWLNIREDEYMHKGRPVVC
jgi:hypothetical protein